MAKNAAAKCYLSKALCFLILLIRLRFTLTADTHSLSCNIMVKTRTILQQPWCEGQCLLDDVPFLQYDNDNKATPLGDLGKVEKSTQVWSNVIQGLESFGKELRKKLADTKLETSKISGQPTLQAIMLSQHEQGQIIGASLQFNISGKYSILLNTMDMSWTLISLEGRDIMNEWKDDEELRKYLNNFKADFNHWHKELLKHHRERTRSTSRAPDVTQLPSATHLPPTINITQPPPTTKFPYKEVFIPLGLISIITAFPICVYVKRKCPTQRDRNHQLPMDCFINCYKPQRKERPMEPSGEFPNQATKMLSQEDEPKTLKVKAFTKPSPHPRVRKPLTSGGETM